MFALPGDTLSSDHNYSNSISSVTVWSLGKVTQRALSLVALMMTVLPVAMVMVLICAGAVSVIVWSVPDRRATRMRPGHH